MCRDENNLMVHVIGAVIFGRAASCCPFLEGIIANFLSYINRAILLESLAALFGIDRSSYLRRVQSSMVKIIEKESLFF